MIATKGYAVHNKADKLAPWNFERRELGPKDVLIDILFSGVCHSDIHQVRSEWGPAIYPMVPGHEIVGRIAEIGSEVANFKIGDLAGIGCMVDSCKECPTCKGGQEQFCERGETVMTYNGLERDKKTPTYGGYATKIVCTEEFVVHVSEKLPIEGVAPLLCAGITTYSPLKRWGIGKGHKVAVLGLGGLGHMAVKFAVSFGAEVTVLSTSPSKKEDAKKLGAHKFVVTKDAEEVKNYKGYFDFIIDTVSAPHDYDMYLNMLNINGVQICVGIPPEPIKLTGFLLLGGNKTITGSSIGGIDETQEMLDYCAEHNIVSDVEVININYVNEAYERVLNSDVKYRFVIDVSTI
ncbi:NAD(P)-dependent alcohol dehydrogenase [Pedobacter changchengzhani]|uniref:NAD(P)-dependent alcohol dehydrogenase n=1 Tax=Pedobacter changchengzhani TaxID=2529274 RepID=A0A4R5MJF8_9SPHI|nr:NAD(P)-dependent alcohol dehydrogenase [Pedobacter changchengzhani]TDG35711.1 NAD(P)-dependent alcohol dehydrogenase [Pedobacter changchengzhani]